MYISTNLHHPSALFLKHPALIPRTEKGNFLDAPQTMGSGGYEQREDVDSLRTPRAGLVKNRKMSQTARGGQADTSGVLLNAQRYRHTPASLSVPF